MENIRKLENSINIVQNTLYNGIYNEVAYKPEPNWGVLLSEYNLAFKQLDSVWSDIDPVFQLYEIVPSKPTQQPAEIPNLLCTTIPSEDQEAILKADMSLSSPHEDIERLILHNLTMKRYLSSYSEKVSQIIKPKRQRITQTKDKLSNDKVKEVLSQFR